MKFSRRLDDDSLVWIAKMQAREQAEQTVVTLQSSGYVTLQSSL